MDGPKNEGPGEVASFHQGHNHTRDAVNGEAILPHPSESVQSESTELVAPTTAPEFGSGTLPPILEQAVSAVATEKRCTRDLPLMGALGVVACALQHVLGRVHVRSGWEEPVCLFLSTSARSSDRKSPALDPFERVLRNLQEALQPDPSEARKHQSAIVTTRMRVDAFRRAVVKAADDKAREDAQAKLDSEEEQLAWLEHNRPLALQLHAPHHQSPENIRKKLIDQRCVGVLAPEPGFLDSVLQPRYAKRNDPQIEELLGAYSGERVSVGLKGEGESERYDTRFSIATFCQPGKLSRILANEEASERGLYGRFLFAEPPGQDQAWALKSRPDQASSAEACGKLEKALLHVIKAVGCPPTREALDNNLPKRWQLRMPEGAGDFLDSLTNGPAALNIKRFEYPHECVLSQWLGKVAGHVIRLAALLHAVDVGARKGDRDVESEIPWERINEAMSLCGYYLDHLIRLDRRVPSGGAKQEGLQHKVLLKLHHMALTTGVNGKPTEVVNKRDLQRKVKCPKADLNEALEALEDDGFVIDTNCTPAGASGKHVRVHRDLTVPNFLHTLAKRPDPNFLNTRPSSWVEAFRDALIHRNYGFFRGGMS